MLKFINWLKIHNQYEVQNQTQLVSVFTGLAVDDSIKSDSADEVGAKLQGKMVGQSFTEVKLKSPEKVKPLSSLTLTSIVKVKDEPVVIDQ